MSYNITSIKIKNAHLVLPIDFDFQGWLRGLPDRDERGNIGKRWLLDSQEPVAVKIDSGATSTRTWNLSMLGKEIRGIVEEDWLIGLILNSWTGEFSGYLYNDILLPLFRDFRGNLDALIVWEGGECIVDLKIVDGTVSETDIG